MTRLFFIWYSIFLFQNVAFGQYASMDIVQLQLVQDQLEQDLANLKLEESKAKAYNLIQDAQDQRLQSELAKGYQLLAYAYLLEHQIDSSIFYFKQSIEKWPSQNQLEIVNTTLLLASAQTKKEQFKKALKTVNEALIKSNANSFKRQSGDAYHILGTIYKQIGDTTSYAKTSLTKALSIFESLNIPLRIGLVQYDLADILYHDNNYEDSRNYLSQAIRFFQTSEKHAVFLAKSYNLEGAIYYDLDDFDQAKIAFQQAIELSQDYQIKHTLFDPIFNLSLIAYLEEEDEVAINLADSALLFAHTIKQQVSLQEHYADIYAALGNTAKEVEALRKQIDLENKLFSENTAKEAAKYRFDIQQLELENTIKLQAKQERLNIYLGMLCGLLFALAGTISFVYLQRQKNQKLVLHNQAIKHHQALTSQINKAEVSIAFNRFEAEREERMRIGKTLHDGASSQLAAAKWLYEENLNAFKKDKLTLENLKKVYEMMTSGYRFLRQSVRELEQENLDWIRELKIFCSKLIESNQTEVTFYSSGLDRPLPYEIGKEVFLIMLNLVANTLEHANAKHLNLQINRLDDELILTIEDDGIGFNPNSQTNGIGLSNTDQRVKALNGTWHIDTLPAQGTTITITIPLTT